MSNGEVFGVGGQPRLAEWDEERIEDRSENELSSSPPVVGQQHSARRGSPPTQSLILALVFVLDPPVPVVESESEYRPFGTESESEYGGAAPKGSTDRGECA